MAVDFKILVLEMIERMGRFQVLFMVLSMVNHLSVSINHLLTTFQLIHPKFHCRDNNFTNCTGSCPGGYVFEGKETSLATEFQLICSRQLLGALVNTLYFAGVTCGSIVLGPIADFYGRRLVVILCLYMQGVLGMLLYFAHSLIIVMTIRTIQGFFVQGLQASTYTLMIEHCNPNLRTLIGAVWEAIWPIGMMYLTLCSYMEPDWHKLQLLLAIPTIITLLWIWMFPESITWLIARNKLSKAYKLSLRMAKWNNDKIFMEEVKQVDPNNITVGVTDDAKTSFASMLKHPILRKHTFIMTFMWLSITLSYYVILFYLPTVGGNIHLNFMVGAAFEAVSCFFAYFILRAWGRRLPISAFQYTTASLCVVIALLSCLVGDEPTSWTRIPITLLVQLGKGIAMGAFYGMFVYCSECFPTGCRGAAIGFCGLFARIGTMLAPQVMLLGHYTIKSFSLVVVALTSIISATATLFLPETAKITLANTMEDVDRLWGK